MSQVIEGVFVDAEGNERRLAVAVDADGKVRVVGSLEVDMSGVEIPAPVGGATEAKQDDEIALLGARLPAALTATGNLKVSIEEGGGGDGLTDTQLRATAVAVSGPLTDTELRAADVKVTLDSETVTLAATESHLGFVGLKTAEVAATFARPADTTAYTAKDAVTNSTSSPSVMTFTNACRVAGGCGSITKARLFVDSATAMLGAVLRLHLYHTAPTAINDNAAFTLLYANRDKRIGYIDFPALATEGTGSDSSAALWIDMPMAYCCAAADRNLYGLLEITTPGAAPASGQNIWVSLTAESA